jgi:uncharacterized membrane protein YkvI
METKKHSKFQRYVLPGLIFQSVVIAGGYGTGAEIAQYFFPYGPIGGLLAMCLVTFLFWASSPPSHSSSPASSVRLITAV